MKPKQNIQLDFVIDKLTNSIENAISAEVFETDITLLTISDSKPINKKDWVLIGLKN